MVKKKVPWFKQEGFGEIRDRGTRDTGRYRDPAELPRFGGTDGDYKTGTTETGKGNSSNTGTNKQSVEQLRSDTAEVTDDKRARVQVSTASGNNSDEIRTKRSAEQDWPSFE